MDPKIVVRATGDFNRLYGDLNRTQSGLARLGRTAAKGAAIGLGLAGAAAIKFGIDSAKSLARIERINAQTVSAIKATGGAAGVTAKHVEDLTGALENKTATEAESIQQGANFLLTFKNIRNEAGKNNDIFDQSVVALTDMSRAMDKTGSATLDTQKGALQLGKALNDPVKGITALTRVGVSFTDQQVKTIKSLTESGDTMKAQKIILRELTSEFGGSGEAFAKTTTGKIELAKHALGTFGETITGAVLPAVADLADKGTEGFEFLTDHADDFKDAFVDIGHAVAPAVDEIREAFGHLIGDGEGLGNMFEDKLLPALEGTSKVIGALVNFVDELPGPVKNLGAEAALAAIGFSLLQGGVVKASGAMAGLIGPTATATTKLAALKGALKTAGGVGGMLLMAKSTQETNDTLSDLEVLAGGALTGFALGGPWGAAIGAGAGLLAALSTSTDDAGDSLEDARPKAEDFAASLDQITAAAQAGTVALARQALSQAHATGNTQSAIELGREFGLSQRTIIQASLGNVKAIAAVNGAINAQGRGWHDLVDDQGNVVARYKGITRNARFLKQELGLTTREINKGRRATLQAARDAQVWTGKLKGIPKKAASRIELNGVKPTLQGVAKVVAKYKGIDKKDIKTILGVTGVEATVKDIQRAATAIKKTDRQEARTRVLIEGAQKVRGEVELTRGVINNLDGDRADVYIVTHRITQYETRGGDSHSNFPGSGRTTIPDRFGFDTLDSFVEVDGRRVAEKAARAGRTIVERLLRGITGGRDDVKSALGRITDLIEKRIDLKDDKKERAREKAILKHLKGQYDALIKIGKAQDRLNRKLDKAREHLAEVQQFADGVRDTLVETGNITNLIEQGRPVTAGNLIRNLQAQVDKAAKFADIIRQLTDDVGPKLNETTLQQLLAAGPAAGLDEANALLAGGDAALQQFNDLTGQLLSTGTDLGSDMSDVMYDVGLQAALGIVAGLEAQDEALDRAARRLARKLAQAVKDALGIKSPSREFQRIGLDTVRGLAIGLDETYVRRQGQRVAASLVNGFSSPVLGADVAGANRQGGALSVSVKLTAEQQSRLQRGKEIILDINAAKSAGVRTVAVGPS